MYELQDIEFKRLDISKKITAGRKKDWTYVACQLIILKVPKKNL